MFDEHSQAHCETSWRQDLCFGDVVSFRFPVAEEDQCSPQARPCLVLDVVALGSGTFLSLAYGTSTETKANRGHDIRVADAKELTTAGLHKPTRFVGALRILVAPEHSGFVANRTIGTPILGRLLANGLLEREDIDNALTEAAWANGYASDHAAGDDNEILRIIDAGVKAGMKEPIDPGCDAFGPAPEEEETAADVTIAQMLGEEPMPGEQKYEPTHDGCICAFVDRHGEDFRYDHDRGAWFRFDGDIWDQDTTGAAKNAARKVCTDQAGYYGKEGRALKNKTAWDAVEAGSRNDPQFSVTSKHWNRDLQLIATPEGVVDLRNGKQRRGRPEDAISKQTAVAPLPLKDFDASRDCPLWINFLEFALHDPETIRFFQQYMGMSLTGLTHEQKLLFIYGAGGNGKSLALNTVSWIAGDYATNVPSAALTAQRHEAHPTELARLDGVRMAIANEVEKGARWAETRVKSLTGGDDITARYMRGDFFTFTPQLTLTVIGNDRPSFTNVDDAMRRRFLLLEMDRKPDVPDPYLQEKLKSEGSGILTWMIQGALDWQENGLIIPPAVQQATTEYLAQEDHFGRFLEECCVLGSGEKVATNDMHESYNCWAPCSASPARALTFGWSARGVSN